MHYNIFSPIEQKKVLNSYLHEDNKYLHNMLLITVTNFKCIIQHIILNAMLLIHQFEMKCMFYSSIQTYSFKKSTLVFIRWNWDSFITQERFLIVLFVRRLQMSRYFLQLTELSFKLECLEWRPSLHLQMRPWVARSFTWEPQCVNGAKEHPVWV